MQFTAEGMPWMKGWCFQLDLLGGVDSKNNYHLHFSVGRRKIGRR
jgi:hypothetical protein